VGAQRRPDAGDLVRGDRGAGPRPAAHHRLLGATVGHVAGGGLAGPRPIGPLRLGQRAGADRLVPPSPQLVRHRTGDPGALRRAPLLLCPANLAPVAFPRNVVVLHDVAALRHPEWYTPGYVAWQRRVLPRVARRARAVVTVSEFSRREIADTLGVDALVIPG